MQKFYIHLHDDKASWAVCDAPASLPAEVGRGALAQIAPPEGEYETVVFVPAIDVVLASAQLPVQRRSQLVQAVPYALEDQLIDDIETLHVALGSQDDSGRVNAAVVAQATMQNWLSQLKDAGIEPDAIVPDVLALERVNGNWSALHMPGDIYCLRSGDETGFACDANSLSLMASRHANEINNLPDAIDVVECGEAASAGADLKTGMDVPVNMKPCNGDALVSLITGYSSDRGINLRQGAFKAATQLLRGRKRWLPAAAMLMAWFVLEAGSTVYEVQQLKSSGEEYQQKITSLFKQTFPKVKRVVDVQKQAALELKALRENTQQVKSGYIELMAKLAPALGGNNPAEIQKLSYRNNGLEVEVIVPDLQKLENLKQAILKVNGVELEERSTSARKDKLVSVLLIRSQI